MSEPQPVTFDVNVLVRAVSGGGQSSFHSWPSPPPVRGNIAANCLGIVNDGREFCLCLSEHVLTNTVRVLAELGWSARRAELYASVLVEVAESAGGGVFEPAVRVTDCPDFEDNRILELALASGSVLIVSGDAHLQQMSPWRAIPVLGPEDFVGRTDAMRRGRRRRP